MSMKLIPLNQLVSSPANARKTDARADIEALAASIASLGLLQNLSVAERGENKFEVVAGARRHAALKLMAKAGTIARDYPVPCNLVGQDGAAEASLAENVQRIAMNAVDEAEAFNVLFEQGHDCEAIARRFGVTTRHVDQRLALANLSPRLKAAYRKGEINLEALRAFCIEPDHAKQDAALRALGKPVTHPGQVRALLTQGAMKTSDRLARFVGLEAYEAAGGPLTRDLFDPDACFIADPALVTRLADERMEAERRRLIGEGWGWVEFVTGHGAGASYCGERIHPTRRPMTRPERKSIAELDSEIEALDAKLKESEEDDALWQARETLDQQRQKAVDATFVWDKALIAHAGVVGSIDYEGRLSFNFGLVRKADQAKLKRVLAARAPEGAAGDEAAPAETEADQGPRLPKTVARELTAARAIALRQGVAEAPHIALALAVYACALANMRRPSPNVRLAAEPIAIGEDGAFDRRRAELVSSLPEDELALLEWCLAQESETLLGALAVLVAGALDLVHEASSRGDNATQALADCLAAALRLDMRKHWSPDRAFLSKLPKAMLLAIAEQAPKIAEQTPARRALQLKTLAKLKRDSLAKALARSLNGAGYLPDLLVTPLAKGALALTDEGQAEASAVAA